MDKLVLATGNKGKIAELRALLAPIHCISQSELGIQGPEETGLTFVENALIKARYTAKISQKPSLGDDSGLVVPALGGKPGLFAARFAGIGASDAENIERLLFEMKDLPDEKRNAFFYAVVVLLKTEDDPAPLISFGQCHGWIAKTIAGSTGFGYDPVFYLAEYGCTVAELPIAIKNLVSHRAKAIGALMRELSS